MVAAAGAARQPRGHRRWVRLSQWASREGIPKRTAQRMFHRKELPVPTKVTGTGRLLVLVDEADWPEEMTSGEMSVRLRRLESQYARLEDKLDRVLEALGS